MVPAQQADRQAPQRLILDSRAVIALSGETSRRVPSWLTP